LRLKLPSTGWRRAAKPEAEGVGIGGAIGAAPDGYGGQVTVHVGVQQVEATPAVAEGHAIGVIKSGD
jgi:hypothetical protein